MQKYTLQRTGDRPLSFTGELIAGVGGRVHSGQEQNRWHEIRIYSTAGGSYVLEVTYQTTWRGEDGHDYAEAHPDIEALIADLRAVDPLEHLRGYPLGDNFAAKQARLERELTLRWQTLVGEILSEILGTEEHVD